MPLKTKLIVLALVAVAAAGGAYAYVTRPVVAPSVAIDEALRETEEVPDGADYVRYRIAALSSVRFQLDEVLNGKPFTVRGETDQVAADILLDVENPSATRIEEVLINARTFKTDSTQRDGAISRLILRSEDPANEFIIFKPGAFMGLPERIVPETPFVFNVTGDLTIAGVTKPTTFYGSGTIDEQGQLVGSAGTKINRADFNLIIPNVPFVADVEEEVEMQIHFVAVKQ